VTCLQGSQQLRLVGRFCATICAGVAGLPRPAAVLTPASPEQRWFSSVRTREKNASHSGLFGEKMAAPDFENPNLVRGALIGLNNQGSVLTEHSRSWARVTRSEGPIGCPGTARLKSVDQEARQPPKGRSFPGRKGRCRPGWCRPMIWEPGAGKVGGQGALIRPERFRGSVHTQHVAGLQRR